MGEGMSRGTESEFSFRLMTADDIGRVPIGCQLDDSEHRDARYQGRGLGVALLDYLLDWAVGAGFAAVTAKATPSHRAVMGFMGGQPASIYEACGFATEASWIDRQLLDVVHERALVPEGTAPDVAARVSLCVKHLAAKAE